MLAPFIAGEAFVRIEAIRVTKRKTRRRSHRTGVAIVRKAVLVLRPQAVDDEAEIRTGFALAAAALAALGAKAWGPGERENIEVKRRRRPGTIRTMIENAAALGRCLRAGESCAAELDAARQGESQRENKRVKTPQKRLQGRTARQFGPSA